MKGDDADPRIRILQLVRALALFDVESATTTGPTFTNLQPPTHPATPCYPAPDTLRVSLRQLF
jgi:hypothetical protein